MCINLYKSKSRETSLIRFKNTVKTSVQAAPFCQNFEPKIMGAAYTRDHCFQRQ